VLEELLSEETVGGDISNEVNNPSALNETKEDSSLSGDM
jgi:hypothetical protein